MQCAAYRGEKDPIKSTDKIVPVRWPGRELWKYWSAGFVFATPRLETAPVGVIKMSGGTISGFPLPPGKWWWWVYSTTRFFKTKIKRCMIALTGHTLQLLQKISIIAMAEKEKFHKVMRNYAKVLNVLFYVIRIWS